MRLFKKVIGPETRRLIWHSFQTFIVALFFIGVAFGLTFLEDLAVATKRPRWLILSLEAFSFVLFWGDALVVIGVMIKTLIKVAKDVFLPPED
jgi:hypothetical protein